MPFYQYHCPKCDKTESALKPISSRNDTTDLCDKKDCKLKLEIFTTGIKTTVWGTNCNAFDRKTSRNS